MCIRDSGNTLRHPIAFADLYTGIMVSQEFIEFLFQLNGERIATGKNAFQAAKINPIHIGVAQQGFVKGRDTSDKIRTLFTQQLRISLGIETGNEYAGSTFG